jgi:hypothetical protein
MNRAILESSRFPLDKLRTGSQHELAGRRAIDLPQFPGRGIRTFRASPYGYVLEKVGGAATITEVVTEIGTSAGG